jgi:hypothetical protein
MLKNRKELLMVMSILLTACTDSDVALESAKIQSLTEDILTTWKQIEERPVTLSEGLPLPDSVILKQNASQLVKQGDFIDSSGFECDGKHTFKSVRFEDSKGSRLEKADGEFLFRSYSKNIDDGFKILQEKSYIGNDLNKAMVYSDASIFESPVLATLVCAKDVWGELEITISTNDGGDVEIKSARDDIQNIIDTRKLNN